MINSLQRYFNKPDRQLSLIRNYLYRERIKALICLLGIVLPFTLFFVVADKNRTWWLAGAGTRFPVVAAGADRIFIESFR